MHQEFIIGLPEYNDYSDHRIKCEIYQDRDNGIIQYVNTVIKLGEYPIAHNKFGFPTFMFKSIRIIKGDYDKTYNLVVTTTSELTYKDLTAKFNEKGIFLIEERSFEKKFSFASTEFLDIIAFIQQACEFEPILKVTYEKLGAYFNIDFSVPVSMNTWVTYEYCDAGGSYHEIFLKHTGLLSSIFTTIILKKDLGDFRLWLELDESITPDARAELCNEHALPISYEAFKNRKDILFESSDKRDIAAFFQLIAKIEPSIRSGFHVIGRYLKLDIEMLTHVIPHWIGLYRFTRYKYEGHYVQRFMPQNSIKWIRLEKGDHSFYIMISVRPSKKLYSYLMQYPNKRFRNKIEGSDSLVTFSSSFGSHSLVTLFVYVLILFEPSVSLLLGQLSDFVGYDLKSPEAKTLIERFNYVPEVEQYLKNDTEEVVKDALPKHETRISIYSEPGTKDETQEEPSFCRLM